MASYSRFILISRCFSTQALSSEQSVAVNLVGLKAYGYQSVF